MPITKVEESVPAETGYKYTGTFTATAGQSLKLETSPSGEEHIDDEVPTGKVWSVSVHITVTENDA